MITTGAGLRRVGLFGGAFDPVHNAHLALARVALEQLQLDQLRWLPTGQAWHKSRPLTDAAQRARLVELAIAGEPRFVLDRRELDRHGPSFTLDTVRELQRELPGVVWFLIIGRDQYASFHSWHGWQELLGRVTLAVAERPGVTPDVHPDVLALPHCSVALPPIDESSTDVRERVAAGAPIDDLVPPAVARYIEQHHLYRGTLGS